MSTQSQFPYDFVYNHWRSSSAEQEKVDTIGNNVVTYFKVDAASGNQKPYFYIYKYYNGYKDNEFAPYSLQNYPEIVLDGKVGTIPVIEAPTRIKFVNYTKGNGLYILNDDENVEESFYDYYLKTDTVIVYLPKGNYKWKLGTKGTTYSFNANQALIIDLASHNVTIDAIRTPIEKTTATMQKRYTIDGRIASSPQKGINILKMSDGTTKKVIVK